MQRVVLQNVTGANAINGNAIIEGQTADGPIEIEIAGDRAAMVIALLVQLIPRLRTQPMGGHDAHFQLKRVLIELATDSDRARLVMTCQNPTLDLLFGLPRSELEGIGQEFLRVSRMTPNESGPADILH